ncbi:calponin homology domain-containing protein, partial [Baffinella frigidus]
WIKDVSGEDVDPADLQGSLRTGTILCELVNKISPKAVRKINTSAMPFAQRENIQNFCDAVARLGVKDINCFAADDLFEGKNLKQVPLAPRLECRPPPFQKCHGRGRARLSTLGHTRLRAGEGGASVRGRRVDTLVVLRGGRRRSREWQQLRAGVGRWRFASRRSGNSCGRSRTTPGRRSARRTRRRRSPASSTVRASRSRFRRAPPPPPPPPPP